MNKFSADTKLRLIVAAIGLALLVIASITNPSAAAALTFPAIYAVIIAPDMREKYSKAGKVITLMSLMTIMFGAAICAIPASIFTAGIFVQTMGSGITVISGLSLPDSAARGSKEVKKAQESRAEIQRRYKEQTAERHAAKAAAQTKE